MTPIDPMHNLFLGTAKHMISVWKTHGLLNEEKCRLIESRIHPFSCPSDTGKLPKMFATSMGSFNADQLKNWTLLFSVYALHEILPEEHLECWRKFVLACRRLCSRYISEGNAKVADIMMTDFCKKFENLYGSTLSHQICIFMVIYWTVFLILVLYIHSGFLVLRDKMVFWGYTKQTKEMWKFRL